MSDPKPSRLVRVLVVLAAVAAVTTILTIRPSAARDVAAWPLLTDAFESTGGGGIIIRGYDPVVSGATCATPFTATTPAGEVFRNVVEFDAIAMEGGVLCANGRWRSLDGSASGTTPFEVFIKDGVKRRSP